MVREYAQIMFSSLIPIIVLLAFIGFFIGLYLWAMSNKRNEAFNHAQNLPLEEGEEVSHQQLRGEK